MSTEPKITVYGSKVCPRCRQTEKFFTGHDVMFDKVDVTVDDEAELYVTQTLGFRTLPVVVVEGMDPWSDYQFDKLKEAVKRYKGV